MTDFHIKQNDISPPITYRLANENQEPIDLTGAEVRFQMEDTSSREVVIDEQAEIVNADNGLIRYNWKKSDTSESGGYQAEFRVKFNDGLIETFPNHTFIEIWINRDISDGSTSSGTQ